MYWENVYEDAASKAGYNISVPFAGEMDASSNEQILKE